MATRKAVQGCMKEEMEENVNDLARNSNNVLRRVRKIKRSAEIIGGWRKWWNTVLMMSFEQMFGKSTWEKLW